VCLQVAASPLYHDKLVIVLSANHFVLVSNKTTGPVGQAFDLMIHGNDETEKAFVNPRVSGQ
jgi:hypothetical protein